MAKRKTERRAKVTPPEEAGVVVPATSPAMRVCVPVPSKELPGEFASAVQELEASLKMPVWLLVQAQHEHSELNYISEKAKNVLFAAREYGLERNKKIALVIDSPGGDAQAAYQIAALLRRHCGGFTAVIPRYAKSAATLIALGADEIMLGEFGELGPLDVQVMNPDREERLSALDEIQSLERLNAFALTALDKAMFMLLNRTGMKIATLLPHVTRFATEMTGPLFGNIDVVRYTQMSRLLKIGEEYARKLLRGRFDGVQVALCSVYEAVR